MKNDEVPLKTLIRHKKIALKEFGNFGFSKIGQSKIPIYAREKWL